MKTMKKFSKIILIILAEALLLLSGCTKQATEEADFPAVKQLECIHPPMMPTMLSAGGTNVLLCWQENDTTKLAVVDMAADSVLASAELEGLWTLREENFDDGSFALFSWNEGCWRFLNSSLEDDGQFDQKNVYGFFSHDRSTYYYLQDGVLMAQQADGGEAKQTVLSENLRFSDIQQISPYGDTLALHCLLSPFSGLSGTAVIDLSTGSLTSVQTANYLPHFYENGMVFMQFDDRQMGYSVCSGGEDTGYFYADASLFEFGKSELAPVEGSPYMLGIDKNTALYSLGAELKVSQLSDCGIQGQIFTSCWLPDTKVIAGAVFENGSFSVFGFSPDKLSFETVGQTASVKSPMTIDERVCGMYWDAVNGKPLPETMQEARSYADRLEEKYDVDIWISSQCDVLANSAAYSFTTTDKAGFSDEVRQISIVLDSLDRTLAMYPDDFCAQLKDSVGGGGVRFLITGPIESDFGVAGLNFSNGSWENIVIDASQTEYFDSIICHELWHATEDVIKNSGFPGFDPNEWSVHNPEGFSYYNDFHVKDEDSLKWTLFSGGDEGIYFVDAYAKQNALEDRARLMEYVMAYPYFAEDLVKAPAAAAKLQTMCDGIRAYFDTSNWGDLPWERYFTQ